MLETWAKHRNESTAAEEAQYKNYSRESAMQETTKPNATEQQQIPARMDVRHEVAQKIIEAMKQGETPWQKPCRRRALRAIRFFLSKP